MPKIEFLGSLVGVEKSVKHKKKDEDRLFVEAPEISDKYGVVRYIGPKVKDPRFAVGDKVYYGSKVDLIRMAGADIYVMEPENVIAKVQETEETPA